MQGVTPVPFARPRQMMARDVAEWFVRYLDLATNRETESRRVASRDEAIGLARRCEQERCIVRGIVGPDGEEPWVQVSPASGYAPHSG